MTDPRVRALETALRLATVEIVRYRAALQAAHEVLVTDNADAAHAVEVALDFDVL